MSKVKSVILLVIPIESHLLLLFPNLMCELEWHFRHNNHLHLHSNYHHCVLSIIIAILCTRLFIDCSIRSFSKSPGIEYTIISSFTRLS